MRPAFSSTKQAAAFALLLLVLLVLPVVMGKNLLPPREQAYAALSWVSGPYPWIRDQIFFETNDIDIAFVGSSHIIYGINTPYVQAKLSEKLGRQAVVRSLSWGGAGYDGLYLITQDLLMHRRVHMLVFYDENINGWDGPDPHSFKIPTLFRFAENAESLQGLSGRDDGLFYFAAIIGMPRNLLCLFRTNVPLPLISNQKNLWETVNKSPNPATLLGCVETRLCFDPKTTGTSTNFAPFTPETAARPTDAIVYSAATREKFEFSTAPIPDWQKHFAYKLASLLREHGVQPVMLYLPVMPEARSLVIPERTFWPKILNGVTLLGIPPMKMFDGISDAELQNLYVTPQHLNENGQKYFTHLITPTLLNFYENSTNH
jgi:hypothetical protein